LTGTVDALSQKQAAGRIARNTPGVKQVENDLVVTSTKLLEDEELLEAVEEALGDFPPSDPARIGVRMVEDGIVYLTGKATSALEARQAANVASRVPGVKGIVSEIDIAPGEPVSDIDIRNGVADALSDDTRIDAFQVEISVEDGEVRLDGFVEDENQVRLASKIAAGVPGVKRVTNRLRGRNE
jgi:osmotically-inducible protein OsmY